MKIYEENNYGYLVHSKGPWKNHKYLQKIGNKYVYARNAAKNMYNKAKYEYNYNRTVTNQYNQAKKNANNASRALADYYKTDVNARQPGQYEQLKDDYDRAQKKYQSLSKAYSNTPVGKLKTSVINNAKKLFGIDPGATTMSYTDSTGSNHKATYTHGGKPIKKTTKKKKKKDNSNHHTTIRHV